MAGWGDAVSRRAHRAHPRPPGVCLRADVAFRAGAAGEAMGEHDGGASESGSGCSDGSSVDSDAAERAAVRHDGVDDMLRAAGLEPATMPGLYAVAHGRAYAGL